MRLSAAGFALSLVAGITPGALAAELSPSPAASVAPAPQLSVFSNSSVRIGYGAAGTALSLSGKAPSWRQAFGGLAVGNAQDVNARFSTHVFGGDIGLFGAYADQPSLSALTPATAWNFGATIGYAGFYVLGAMNDAAAFGPFQGSEGWAAGFGYELGSFDLRLTYAASESGALLGLAPQTAMQQWSIGGIYNWSSRFRVNADAFYSGRERMAPYPAASTATSGATQPQGTGARVGVQLRF